jgi:hypothetical protein
VKARNRDINVTVTPVILRWVWLELECGLGMCKAMSGAHTELH